MTNPDNQKPVEVADVETAQPTPTPAPPSGPSVITQTWKREDLIKQASPIARICCLVFSLLAFIIMASNKHGPGLNFDNYEEFRYVLAIAIISTVYTGWQTFVHFSKKEFFDRRTSMLIDFSVDKIVAYLLMSAASAAIPLTNRWRDAQTNTFIDSVAASISMAFFAFMSLAVSALFSGHKLSTQSVF